MPFDPTLPANNSVVSSAELRGQYNALKALYDAQAAQLTALTATVASQTSQIAALNTAMLERMRTADALLVFASNVAAIGTDSTTFDEPPNAEQVGYVRDKLNELINGLQGS